MSFLAKWKLELVCGCLRLSYVYENVHDQNVYVRINSTCEMVSLLSHLLHYCGGKENFIISKIMMQWNKKIFFLFCPELYLPLYAHYN